MPLHEQEALSSGPGPQKAPTPEETQERKDKEKALAINPLRYIPGTYANQLYEHELLQQDWRANFVDGFMNSALYTVGKKFADEGILGPIGVREEGTPYNKDEARANMPLHYTRNQIEDLLSEPTAESLGRAKVRLDAELERGRRMAGQDAGGGIATLVGQTIDVDLPFFLVTGAAFRAVGMARGAYRAARSTGLSHAVAKSVSGVASGLNMGAQAGAVIAGVELTQKESATWQDAAILFIGATVFGGTIGGVTRMNTDLIKARTKAERELMNRLITDDPNVNGTLDVDTLHREKNAMPGDVFEGQVERSLQVDADGKVILEPRDTKGKTVIGGETPKGLGAEAVEGSGIGSSRVELTDPAGPMSDAEVKFLDFAYKWRNDSDFLDKKLAEAKSLWVKVMTSKIGSFGMRTITQMYTSKSAGMNWLGGVMFEGPNGLNRGAWTASTGMEMYHRRIQQHIAGNIDPLMFSWAKNTNNTWSNSGHGISNKGLRAFNRELALEMNERLHGRASNPGREIGEAADRYDIASATSVDIGRGRLGQRALDGAERWEAQKGWTPYVWKGQEIARLERAGVTRVEIEAGMAEGYRAAGLLDAETAAIVSKATVHRALARHEGVDSSVTTLFTGDGRKFMEESLRLNGVNETQIQGIMKKLVGDLEERSQPGFTKSRNNIDMNISIKNSLGLDLKIVDLLDQDMAVTWQRYSRQLSGSAALARIGITNRAQRQVVIDAIRAEMRALGEDPIDADKLHAMMSHFNGGPVWGFANGVTNHGISPMIAVAKRIANLGLLEKLGLTQLGETGAMMAQMGVRTWYQRGPMQIWDKELRNSNRALLDEVSYMIGAIGNDQRHYAEWKMLDEISVSEQADWMAGANRLTGNASFIQAYTSGFNHVRRLQQEIAVNGMIDKVFRTIRAGDTEEMLRRFETDLGLGRVELDAFQRMIDDGTIEFHPTHGYVERLNMETWDQDLAETFGAAMTRNMNQVVQKSMAGEQDAWMHTEWGSLMTHLKTFPMAAFQKQFLRNGRHMDMQSVTSMLFGLSTAMVAINIRDLLDGRERSIEEKAIAAFGYNNMSSWVSTLVDPTMTLLGLHNYRINPYGPHASLMPPTMNQLDNLLRVPGAVPKFLTGNADYYDRQAIKALPFAGTYVFSRLFDK